MTRPDPDVAWVLYDGPCGLCDRVVAFLLRRDRHRGLRFATLQGATGRAVRGRHPGVPPAADSFLLVESPQSAEEQVLAYSDAAIGALVRLGGGWRAAAVARLVPRSWRDAVYRFIARRRDRWFGRLNSCRVPGVDERSLFLD